MTKVVWIVLVRCAAILRRVVTTMYLTLAGRSIQIMIVAMIIIQERPELFILFEHLFCILGGSGTEIEVQLCFDRFQDKHFSFRIKHQDQAPSFLRSSLVCHKVLLFRIQAALIRIHQRVVFGGRCFVPDGEMVAIVPGGRAADHRLLL